MFILLSNNFLSIPCKLFIPEYSASASDKSMKTDKHFNISVQTLKQNDQSLDMNNNPSIRDILSYIINVSVL